MSKKQFSASIAEAMKKARAYLLSKYQINESDVNDILQEASMKALKNLKAFRGQCSFETWFISICKNELKSFFRSKNKREQRFVTENDETADSASCEADVVKKSEFDEAFFLIHSSLSKLSQKHREVIEIVLKNASSSKEIADTLQIPINSARTRLHYAKRHLKKLIELNAHKSNIQLSFDR